LEGAQIRHGMRGAAGAIEKVTIGDDVDVITVGDVPAIGICGSGLIDACAKMLDAGVLDASGLLRRDVDAEKTPELAKRSLKGDHGREFVLEWSAKAGKDEDITLTQGDIRQFQLAKSAIYSGIVMLQKVMDVSDEALGELMLCGGFGNYINIASAVTVRLLPELPHEKISYVGNAASLGAQMALLSETERNRAWELARSIEHVALAASPDFQTIFIEGMSFGDDPNAGRKHEKVERPRRKRAQAGG
ncbi:MAG: ATP-binding protein, partial [Gammaproteobacteria bacterium]|nr:ATP-binding protein [Gammaproteobacteria bacterium]